METQMEMVCDETETNVILNKKPICVVTIGQSKSGKTKFVQNLVSTMYETGLPYVINLDPVCDTIPYPPNLDIRDAINYTDVMERYGLNLKCGIFTTLNIYTTKFVDIIENIGADGEHHEYIVIDTPGNAGLFSPSGCGPVITRALASRFPTVIAYVMDSNRVSDPAAFMCNMINAHSIKCRTKVPVILVLNKIDIIEHRHTIEWIYDFEVLKKSLETNNVSIKDVMSVNSKLNDFPDSLRSCAVSAITTEGIPAFFNLLQAVVAENESLYQKHREAHEAEQSVESSAQNFTSNQESLVTPSTSCQEIVDYYVRVLAHQLDADDSQSAESDSNKQTVDPEQFNRFLRLYKEQVEKEQAILL